MKKLALPLFLFASAAFAHGPVADQAAHAVDMATKVFLAKQPKETTRMFQSVFASLTGHERFAVTITLRDNTTKFKYDCVEDETVEPVEWICKE